MVTRADTPHAEPPTVATTFGELPIGETFWWRNTAEIQHGPEDVLARRPFTKTSDTRYEWEKGYGIAEAHYPIYRRAEQARRHDLPRRLRDRLRGSK